MSYVGHSFVWPPDYNWFSISDTPKLLSQHQPANASFIYPWFLSMWAIGAFGSSTTTERSKILLPAESAYYRSGDGGGGGGDGGGDDPASAFREVIRWKSVDIQYPTVEMKMAAMKNGKFVPENNLPLGVHAYRHRIFVSLPKWKEGVPVTLGYVTKTEGSSPAIKPYPDWSWHLAGKCEGLTSVFRMDIDVCERLWVLDSGVVDAENTVNQLCPPQIVVFDLRADRYVWRYRIPSDQSPDSSLLSNIVVEVLRDDCADAYAYLGDVFRYGLIVYSYKHNRSWRVTHSYFYPDPLASDYFLDGIEFQWVDGLFGMSLSPADKNGERTLYFHPLSSYREFAVPTKALRNETIGFAINRHFRVLGQPRAEQLAHSTGSAVARNGVQFYNLLTRSAVACWNTNGGAGNEYGPATQAVLLQSNRSLSFPNDLRVDIEAKQSVWVLSNRLHRFLYDKLDPNEVNFVIFSADADRAVQGTICDPQRRRRRR